MRNMVGFVDEDSFLELSDRVHGLKEPSKEYC